MTHFEDPEDRTPGFEFGDQSVGAAGEQHGEPIPDAAITAPNDRDEPAEAQEAADVVPTRRPFGELSVETREATHPFKLAESVDPAELDKFYQATARMSDDRQAWYDIEHTLADPRHPRLESAAFHVDRAIEDTAPVEPDPSDPFAQKFESDSDAELWYAAAKLKAFIPAFEARAAEGRVTPEAAGEAYWGLVKDVLPNTETDGNKAEALVGALAAREGLMVDPEKFLYPTSPREGNNHYRPDDKTLNHDYVRIDDDHKMPVEVKVRGSVTSYRPSHYDSHIATVRFVNDIGPAILGAALPDGRSIGRAVPVVFARAEQLMRQELDQSIRVPELDAAAEALYNRILSQRAHPMPDRFRTRRLH